MVFSVITFDFPYDNDTIYSAHCCNRYWELHKAKGGVTAQITFSRERIVTWITDDEYEWELPHPYQKKNSKDIFGYVTAHLPFRCNIENNRWAALYHSCLYLVVPEKCVLVSKFRIATIREYVTICNVIF
jgi:hypothetical protein